MGRSSGRLRRVARIELPPQRDASTYQHMVRLRAFNSRAEVFEVPASTLVRRVDGLLLATHGTKQYLSQPTPLATLPSREIVEVPDSFDTDSGLTVMVIEGPVNVR